jgi:hypothetical protein
VDAHRLRLRLLEEYNIEIAAGFGARCAIQSGALA